MSGKRQASYTIDPTTLEQKEKDEDSEPQLQTTTRKLPKEQRKIFKIKRPGDIDTSDKSEAKVAFKLSQSQEIKPAGDDAHGTEEPKEKEISNPFANLSFKADKNIFNGIGIFSNVNSINLFTSNKGTEQSAQANANPTSGPSIFAKNETTNGKSIFNNGSTSLKGTSASLFGQAKAPVTSVTPVAATNNDDDGSGDSAQLQEAQKIESDPSKSTATFTYDDTCPVLLTLKASKFKKAGSDLIENVELVLQKQKQTNIKYISVRLPVTKKSIFSGILVEKRSEVRNINQKKQNVEVTAFIKEKDAFVKVPLKFQFDKEEDGEKLFERLQEMLTGNAEGPKSEKAKEKKE